MTDVNAETVVDANVAAAGATPAVAGVPVEQEVDASDPLAAEVSLFEEVAEDDNLDLESIIGEVAEGMADDDEYTMSSVIPAHTAVARLTTFKPSVVVMKATNKQVVRYWQIGWNLEYNTETGAHGSRSFNQRIYVLKKDGTSLAVGKEQLAHFLAGLVIATEHEGAPEMDKTELRDAKKAALVRIKAGEEGYSLPALMQEGIETPMVLDVTVKEARGDYEADNNCRYYSIRPVDEALVAMMAETAEQ